MRKTCCSLGVLIKVKQVCLQSRIHWLHMTQPGTRHSSRSTMLRQDCTMCFTRVCQRKLRHRSPSVCVAQFNSDKWLVPVKQSDLPWCPWAIQHSHLHKSGHLSGPHPCLSNHKFVQGTPSSGLYFCIASNPRCLVLSCQHCLPLTMQHSE